MIILRSIIQQWPNQFFDALGFSFLFATSGFSKTVGLPPVSLLGTKFSSLDARSSYAHAGRLRSSVARHAPPIDTHDQAAHWISLSRNEPSNSALTDLAFLRCSGVAVALVRGQAASASSRQRIEQ